jgi:LysM repeat protein
MSPMGKDESNIKLSDEFKKDLKKKPEVNWPAISGLVILIVIIFGSLGIGTYQIFYKPEKVQETTTSEEKIQSRPTEASKSEEKKETPTPPAATAPQATAPANPTFETYTVLEGDTLSGIASKYDTTSKAIADFNGWTDPEQTLQIGQKIKIPK